MEGNYHYYYCIIITVIIIFHLHNYKYLLLLFIFIIYYLQHLHHHLFLLLFYYHEWSSPDKLSQGGPFMAAIIGPGGTIYVSQKWSRTIFFTIILLPRMVLPGQVIAGGDRTVYGSHNWSGWTIYGSQKWSLTIFGCRKWSPRISLG